MNLVKEHKGTKIFISPKGEFYCDTVSNSNDYNKKNFTSTKLTSIEKAIDNFNGHEIDGNQYYDIAVYNGRLHSLKVIKKVGDRLFFDDGTDTSCYTRRELYPKDIDKNKEFKNIESLFEQMHEKQQEINNLYNTLRDLKLEAENKLKQFSKVKVS